MEDARAILIQVAEQLGVRRERTGADAKDEAAFGQVIEHRRMGGDQHRMRLREIGRASRKLDLPRFRDERCEKLKAVGHVLDDVGDVLAAERVVEAELIGEDKRLTILLEGLDPIPMRRVHRHGEKAKSHVPVPDHYFSNMLMIPENRCPVNRA